MAIKLEKDKHYIFQSRHEIAKMLVVDLTKTSIIVRRENWVENNDRTLLPKFKQEWTVIEALD